VTDRIVLIGMAFEARHGVNDWEKTQAQRFEVDVELFLATRRAGTSDELAQTVDYREVYDLVRRVLEGPPVDLIETLAESIAHDALEANRRARKVIVRVRKPEVQLGGPLAFAGVEVVRRRTS
jgi:7,8-dihydroneopterin aldolase/epimerase/oxygenase